SENGPRFPGGRRFRRCSRPSGSRRRSRARRLGSTRGTWWWSELRPGVAVEWWTPQRKMNATMSRTIDLKIFKNEQLVGSRTFSQEVIKIGKLRSSDLYLDDASVARMHAVLEVTAGDLRLVDLGSASGTSLNGERVCKSAAIASGDSLRVGPFRLEVEALPVATTAIASAPRPTAAPHSPSPAMAASALAVAPAYAPAPASVSPRATLPVDARDVEHDDRHVAEVVARYGKTVLDVQHVGQVRGRRRQAPAFFALGGLLLLAGGGLLAHEVSQDWEGY